MWCTKTKGSVGCGEVRGVLFGCLWATAQQGNAKQRARAISNNPRQRRFVDGWIEIPGGSEPDLIE